MADRIFAENRLGLGPKGDTRTSGSDPRGWALAQLGTFQPKLAARLPTRAEVADDIAQIYEARRDARQEKRGAAELMNDAAMPNVSEQSVMRSYRQQARNAYLGLVGARVQSALTTDTPFLERMAHFWANHFAVSATKVTTVGYAGLLEMEAIRPQVTGRFRDMLVAALQHPAMLLYLDQAQSIGPGSRLGTMAQRRGNNRGLNENLAREILELHTLGVRTGYSQADVTEFARTLTGWNVGGMARGPVARLVGGNPGEFVFVEGIHEPGDRTILGKRFPAAGLAQGMAVLDMLAVHPATARHIATKLARHFASDEPPPAMVARLEQAFLKSGGDLPTVYRALVESPEVWAANNLKFRDPWDWLVASLRAVGAEELDERVAFATLKELGQPVWQPPSPAGWDDVAASWAGPNALVRRVEVAQRIANRVGDGVDARVVAPAVLGSRLSERTKTAIGRAESPKTGLALLLASPEMLRR